MILFLALLFISSGSAEDLSDDLAKAGDFFQRIGFENVEIWLPSDGQIAVQYENRVFHNQVYAVGIILGVLSRQVSGTFEIQLYPQNRGLDIGGLSVSLEKYRQFVEGVTADTTFIASLVYIGPGHTLPHDRICYRGSRSFLHLDLVLAHPGFVMQLGNFDDSFKWTLNLVPELDATLWRGANLEARVMIPIHDEIKLYRERIRLSRLVASQMFSIAPSAWLRLRSGVMEPDRWGVSIEIARLTSSSRFLYGGSAQCTGFFLQEAQTVYFSQPGTWSGGLDVYYFVPKWDLTLGGSYNKYLYGEYGPKVSISRRFQDIEIGFFAAHTNIDDFGGIVLEVPLPPLRHPKPGRWRAHWPSSYAWNYRSTSGARTIGSPLQSGVMVTSGSDMKAFLKHFTFSYIKNNLSLWLKAHKDLLKQGTSIGRSEYPKIKGEAL